MVRVTEDCTKSEQNCFLLKTNKPQTNQPNRSHSITQNLKKVGVFLWFSLLYPHLLSPKFKRNSGPRAPVSFLCWTTGLTAACPRASQLTVRPSVTSFPAWFQVPLCDLIEIRSVSAHKPGRPRGLVPLQITWGGGGGFRAEVSADHLCACFFRDCFFH